MADNTPLLKLDWRNLVMASSGSVVTLSDAPAHLLNDAWGRPVRLREDQRVRLYAADSDEAGDRDDLLFEGTIHRQSPGERWCVWLDNRLVRRRSTIDPCEPHWANSIDWQAIYDIERSPPPPSLRREILVVDDDPGVVQLLRTVLEQWGYAVRTAASGRQAIQEIERRHPDLILLDVVMPDMDGIGFLEHRRADQALAAVPTVVITAFPAYAAATTAELGAQGLLSKPFGLDELMVLVDRVTAG
jgi:CheY-like chemotaxis protein